MESTNLRRGRPPSTANCRSQPCGLPPKPHAHSSSPHFVWGLHHFPSLQPSCQSLQHSNPPPPLHIARSNQQFVPLPQQSAPAGIQTDHYSPQHQPNPSPPQKFASIPHVQSTSVYRDHHLPRLQHPNPPHHQNFARTPQKSGSPKFQREHHFPQQHPCPPSKRQRQSELGEPDEQHNDNNYKTPAKWTICEAQRNVYQPEAAEDPFKYSRSLRHQQPANSHRKRNDDEESPDDEDEDEDEDSELDEELVKEDQEEIAYAKLLPKVKQLITDLGVNDKWTLDKEEKICMVCTFPVHLKGWTALLQHAETFQKRKHTQHRAYFRALTEQLKHGIKMAEDIDGSYQLGEAVLIERGKGIEEVMVWPPVVIIDNMKEKEHLDQYVPNLRPSDVQRTIRLSNRGHPGVGRMLVVFPASEVGHLHSKLLIDSLAKLATPIHKSAPHQLSKGRPPLPPPPPQHVQHRQGADSGGIRQDALATGCPPRGYWERQSQQQRQKQGQEHQPPRGFLAQAADMQQMDPRRNFVRWSLEKKREILKCILKKSKEEHDLGRAKVKAKLVEVDHIAESHQQFKSRKTVLSQQLRDAEMALQLQKEREDQIAKQHAEQLQMMDEKFKEEVRRLEVERIAREDEIQQLLEANEKQLDLERIAMSEEIEILVMHLENVNQELQNQTAQKALDKEREIARKRENLNNEIKLKEEKFNEEGHILERDLVEKQESEKIKFIEEYNTTRQEFLTEWVTKQAALKEKAETAKQEKENLMRVVESKEGQDMTECSICFEDFNENRKRALIQPCGHAKTCFQCAVDIFGKSKLCPICRVKMSTKPKVIPTKLYM